MTAPQPIRLSLHAMATRFELLLYGAPGEEARLRAAGEEALGEIARLEAQLSFYLPASELSWINAHAARGEAVRVEPRLFQLLRNCAALTARTDGAFDITVGPLMRAWRFVRGHGAVPADEALEAARQVTGINLVEFDDEEYTIRFARPGVEFDLGGYGKGYAIGRALELLAENGVENALLHGGTSSVATLGTCPPAGAGWEIGLHDLFHTGGRRETVTLSNESLSVSAVHGKSFAEGGRTYGHVLDPRRGEPVRAALAAAASGPAAEVCEALSTALLVLGPAWLSTLTARFPAYAALVAFENGAGKVDVARTKPRTEPEMSEGSGRKIHARV